LTDLVSLIRGYVQPSECMAVFISGGLDSTIVLHHLTEKSTEKIHTYTVGFQECNEWGDALRVSKHYGTLHTEIEPCDILRKFSELQAILDRPRFNLWPVYAYEAAAKDGCQNIYIGEGLDEHFGGYWYKSVTTPQELWSGVLEWSLPTHRQLAKRSGLTLHHPLISLPLKSTIRHWRDPHRGSMDKVMLRRAYRGVLPDFVVGKRKNPGRINWENPELWNRLIKPVLGLEAPETHEEANRLVNVYLTRKWVEYHEDSAHR